MDLIPSGRLIGSAGGAPSGVSACPGLAATILSLIGWVHFGRRSHRTPASGSGSAMRSAAHRSAGPTNLVNNVRSGVLCTELRRVWGDFTGLARRTWPLVSHRCRLGVLFHRSCATVLVCPPYVGGKLPRRVTTKVRSGDNG